MLQKGKQMRPQQSVRKTKMIGNIQKLLEQCLHQARLQTNGTAVNKKIGVTVQEGQ
jgi:hypothetical protein